MLDPEHRYSYVKDTIDYYFCNIQWGWDEIGQTCPGVNHLLLFYSFYNLFYLEWSKTIYR